MDSLKRKGPEDTDAAPAADEPFSQFKRPRSTALAVVEQPVTNGALTVFESGAQSKAVVQHRNFNVLSSIFYHSSFSCSPLLVLQMPMRTSSLEAPTMLLEGHKGHVYGCAFDSTGNSLASCSFDKSVLLWNLRGSISSYASLVGHKVCSPLYVSSLLIARL
jgi:WD40 repeat protein